jgi:hypothetical protein
LSNSNNNNFSSSTVSNINGTQYAYGIYLELRSNNNSFSSSTTVSYINATQKAYGIWLKTNSNDNSFSSSTVSNIKADKAQGIRLSNSNNNTFSSSTSISHINAGNDAWGIALDDNSDDNTFSSSTNVSHINATNGGAYGIGLVGSNNNTFDTGSISGVNTDKWWDFWLNQFSEDNVVTNFEISSYPTNISFTCANGIKIKSVDTAPSPDPSLKRNIRKYVNATNTSADSWLYLNISYNASDISDVQEDSLSMWKHNGTWHEVAGVNGVNTTGNYVYANITEFGSIFAPLGNPPPVNCTCGDICVNETGWWRDGGTFNASNTPIHHAIDNATVGDTICVKNGTYNENVDV